jgi:transposase
MDDTGCLTMSAKELNRLEILGRVLERRLTQAQAADQLGLGIRQVERLCRKLRVEGPRGLVSQKRGHASNRKLPTKLRERAVMLVQSRYSDFGPTLAAEKLRELHGVFVSVETLRRWMIAEDLWVPRSQRTRRVHQPRHRRSCVGELIQIDGCDHEWFEDRAPRCTLLVYVDDATSRLMELRFVASESTFDYFASTQAYLERHGKPVAFYSDKASIFRANGSEARRSDGLTQFGRALSELNIDIICANTPQAKGRVERAHLTLQDRLVKELRLRGLSTPEAANAYAPEFTRNYNGRFAKAPLSDHDVHRPVRDDEDLALIFTCQENRKISQELTLHFQRGVYLIESGPETLGLRGHRCRVHAYADGRIELRHEGRSLPFRAFEAQRRVTQGNIVSHKRLGAVLSKIHADQRSRDAERLASPNVSLRQKGRIRAARTRANAPVATP